MPVVRSGEEPRTSSRFRPRLGAAGPGWHALLLSLALGCDDPNLPAQTQAGAAEPPARYWLRNAPLLDRVGGAEVRRIRGPVQVELFPDGRVRSVPNSGECFEGYLSPELRAKPHRDQGLMLYVQRTADLRLERPDGPVVGRVHSGALLTVTTQPGNQAAVGIPGFDEGGSWPGYVARDALGVEPTELRARDPDGGPKRVGVPSFPLALPFTWDGGKKQLAFTRCYPVWFPESGHPRQIIDGVELSGPIDGDPSYMHHVRVIENSVYCSATLVTRHDQRLFLVHPDGREEEVAKIPSGFLPVALPDPARLAMAITRNESVFWLRYDHPQVSCVEARFESGRRHIRALKLGASGYLQELGDSRTRYRAIYRLTAPPHPPRLTLDPAPDAEWTHQGEYFVLADDGAALLLTGQRMSEAAIAFDPTDVERWYFSRAACESARDAIVKQMKEDPGVAFTAGFHVSVPAPPR